MRISVQNALLVGQTTTFLQVHLGVDTIAILYFALTSSKNASTTKVEYFFSEWIYNSKQTSNISGRTFE